MYRICMKKFPGKCPLARLKRGWKAGFQMCLRKIGHEDGKVLRNWSKEM
jgi:hypothetical protein